MKRSVNKLKLKNLGIDTYKEAVIYLQRGCYICRAEGFEAQARIKVCLDKKTIIATLNVVDSQLLEIDEASLSSYAWELLDAYDGAQIELSHPALMNSFRSVRSKVYGHELKTEEINEIINDVSAGSFSNIETATFLTACAGDHLNQREILDLTKAMIASGSQLNWDSPLVVDKHCVGGIPGNRTSMIVVPIVAAFGLVMPKTSSRAITSPAGTADTMEVLAPVDLDLASMRRVVEMESGCIVWGGSMDLSPADDILIRIEKVIDIDSEGQMVASILSKKIAAGSTHIIIDIPIGATAKVRTMAMANLLKCYLESIGKSLGVIVNAIFSDGSQPIGRGIGPSLEAEDVLAVLQNNKDAPEDLREHALMLAGSVIELSNPVVKGTGKKLATDILASGAAWRKFQNICHAQGGLFEPLRAPFTHVVRAKAAGKIISIHNRKIARLAKLAGAPRSKSAGVELLVKVGVNVHKDEPLFVIHSEFKGELNYAIDYLLSEKKLIDIVPI